jgi:transposase
MDLPQSDACFVKAYPAETTEAFLDGHVSAFAFFDGVPLSILYDNTKIAVAKICGDGKPERTRAFTGLISHYLFTDRFGGPGKGNDKPVLSACLGMACSGRPVTAHPPSRLSPWAASADWRCSSSE